MCAKFAPHLRLSAGGFLQNKGQLHLETANINVNYDNGMVTR